MRSAACMCVRVWFVYFHRALAEGPMRHPCSSSWKKGACNICMHSVTGGLGTEHRMPSALRAAFKCLLSFRLSTVTENVRTINRIDFLKSYCCFALSECHFLSFQTTKTLPSVTAFCFLLFAQIVSSSPEMSGCSL